MLAAANPSGSNDLNDKVRYHVKFKNLSNWGSMSLPILISWQVNSITNLTE